MIKNKMLKIIFESFPSTTLQSYILLNNINNGINTNNGIILSILITVLSTSMTMWRTFNSTRSKVCFISGESVNNSRNVDKKNKSTINKFS